MAAAKTRALTAGMCPLGYWALGQLNNGMSMELSHLREWIEGLSIFAWSLTVGAITFFVLYVIKRVSGRQLPDSVKGVFMVPFVMTIAFACDKRWPLAF
jgi:hypothetical protein